MQNHYCSYCDDSFCKRLSHQKYWRLDANTIRTQKATGVRMLSEYGWNVVEHRLVSSAESLPGEWEYANAYWGIGTYGQKTIFARPCPVRPRHGFVDSRPVKTLEEAQEVFSLAQASDPEAEMLLMPTINADLNAIWTPGHFVVGPGHDGATSGHDSFTIPLAYNTAWMTTWVREMIVKGRIKDPDVPYFELVSQDQNVWFTQMRGGPKLDSTGPDFIPESLVVQQVITAEGDLLEWEQRTAQLTPGTVVWHPGGSMASHYAIHCKLHNIPILTSAEPTVGQTITPTKQLPPVDYDSVVGGIGAGMSVGMSVGETSPAVSLLLTGLHNQTAFSGNDGYWLGVACALMQRLGTAGLLGEARHGLSQRLGCDRDNIYQDAFNRPFTARRNMRRAVWLFGNYVWRSGYGGKAWYVCGQALIELDEAMRQFVHQPDKAHYTQLVSSLNTAVNVAHNGGWWLNKFCGEDLLNMAVQGHPHVQTNTMPLLNTLRNLDDEKIEEAVSMYKVAREITIPERGQIAHIELPKPAQKPTTYHNANYAQAKWLPDPVAKTASLHVQYRAANFTYGAAYKTHDLSFGQLVDLHNEHLLNHTCNHGNTYDCLNYIFTLSHTVDSLAPSSTQYVEFPIFNEWVCLPGCGTPLFQLPTSQTNLIVTSNVSTSDINLQPINTTTGAIPTWQDILGHYHQTA